HHVDALEALRLDRQPLEEALPLMRLGTRVVAHLQQQDAQLAARRLGGDRGAGWGEAGGHERRIVAQPPAGSPPLRRRARRRRSSEGDDQPDGDLTLVEVAVPVPVLVVPPVIVVVVVPATAAVVVLGVGPVVATLEAE